MNILYVEDNAHDADLTSRALVRQMPNIHIDLAATLSKARTQLTQAIPYDLLLVDLQLPDGSGLELLNEIREQGLSIAVVVLTGSGDEEAVVAALKAGADDYLVKHSDYLTRLPLALKTALIRSRAESVRKTRPLRVLYAEPNTTDADLTRRHLARYASHIRLDVVQTVSEVLHRLPAQDPCPWDIMLLDYHQPGLNALDLLKAVRQERKLDLPIVFVTSHGDEEVAIQALRLGAADYLVKHPSYLFQLPAVLENAYYRTELAHEQAALSASEERYRRLAENAPDIIYRYRLRPAPGFEYINAAVVTILGYTPEEFYAQSDLAIQLIYADDRPLYENLLSGVAQDQPPVLRWVRNDGEIIWIEQHIVPIHNDAGELVAIEGIARDITERKQTEEHIRQSEENFRLLFANNPHSMWVYDLETLAFLEVNDAAVARYGYSRDEFLTMALPNIRPSEDVARLLEDSHSNRPVLQYSGEWRHRLKQGAIIDVEITSHTLDFAGHKAALVVAQDITERKQARLAEREQRVLAEALRDVTTALISALDLDAVMTTILENVARVVPHDAANIMLIEADIIRPVYWRGYPPELIPLVQQFHVPLAMTPNLNQMFMSGLPFLVSHTSEYPDWVHGPLTDWVHSYVAAPIRSQGKMIGFLNLDSATAGFFTTDHARRLQAFADQVSIAIEHAQLYEEIRGYATELERRVEDRTAQLNNAKDRIEAILISSSDIIILCRADGIITQVNPAFGSMFKSQPTEALSQPVAQLAISEHRSLLNEAFEEVVNTRQPKRLEISAQWGDASSFDADVVLSPIVEQNHNLLGVVCSLRDITDQKRMEAQLRQTLEHEVQVSDLKSRYVSMAAHDLRNPLAVIQTIIGMLHHYGDRLTDEEKQVRYDRIQANIQTMVDMLDDILIIGKAESGKLNFTPAPLDVINFCHTLISEIKLTAGSMSLVEISTAGSCTTGIVDANLLRHILANLLSNAVKYSPAERPVMFSVRCDPDQIVFLIRDQGIGIPLSDQPRLFEAFHRAQNVGRTPGTGLGLAVVKRSVDLHGGTITFTSEEGSGTTFTVTLPQQIM